VKAAGALAIARGRPCILGLSATCLMLVSGCGGSSTSTSSQPAPLAPATSGAVKSSSRHTEALATSTSHTVLASVAGVIATMHAGTHTPKVNAPWPLRFTVTRGGRPVRASVTYEFLFGGQVVARRSHYNFVGHFSDFAVWPASSVGYPLTFRAAIVAGTANIDLDFPVQVTR
jgi:hypothetical protein